MTASVIDHVNQLGSLEPAMLTWTNRHGDDIGNGPLWDTMATSGNASDTSTVAGEMEEVDDDDVVSVAEEDQEMPTIELNVVDNITGVDDAHDVYKQWDEVVPEAGDVIDHIDNDVQVVTESTPGGVTTKWDQPPLVSPTVSTAAAEVKVSPSDTG